MHTPVSLALAFQSVSFRSKTQAERLLNPVENAPKKPEPQPENPFAALVPDQQFITIPTFTLESGEVLYNAPVAYTTRGQLSENKDNALVICHALSGSADVADWWGPLLGGPGQAFDVTRFFVVCLNSLGSPYGTASPVTSKNGDSSLERYGPEFPLTTIRDDVKYVGFITLVEMTLTSMVVFTSWCSTNSECDKSPVWLVVPWAAC